jgi:hypothetical protein
LSGSEEIKKAHTSAFTCLRNAQQDKVVPDAVHRAFAFDAPAKPYKCLDRVLSIVVVPRDSVVIEKCEKLARVALETLFVTDCNVRMVITPSENFIEAIDGLFVPS